MEIIRSAEIAYEMGKYCSTIGTKLLQKVPPSAHPVDYYVNKINQNKKSLYLSPTNPIEIGKIINNLKNKPSCGHDQMSNVLLKWLCPVVSEPLSIIFNKSLSGGEFPELMKLSDVIPLYKSKERYLCSNY